MIQEANLTWRYIDTESNLLLPWYTKAALEWLKSKNVKDWLVFEFGGGYSSIWWRLNAKQVHSVEHDKKWADAMAIMWRPDKEDYISQARSFAKFDCIIVDGEWREECTKAAAECVAPGGYLIFDNYGQPEFTDPSIIDLILEGWIKEVHRQYNHTSWATAIFQKPIA